MALFVTYRDDSNEGQTVTGRDLVKYRVPVLHDWETKGPRWCDMWLRAGTSDEQVLDEILVNDVYHLRGLEITRPSVEVPRPLVLDIGACTGIFAAMVARMLPDVRIVAVEPDRENVELLTLNTAKWRDRIEIVPKAVGAHEGTTTLFGSHATGHTKHDAHSDDFGVPVEQITLASLLTEPVALLKVDCEGQEMAGLFDSCSEDQMCLVDRVVMETHGTREAPWIDDAPRRYGELVTKLAFTHSVQAFGRPDEGGYLFAHSYRV